MNYILLTEAHLSPDSVGYSKTAWVLIKDFDPLTYSLFVPSRVLKGYTTPLDPDIKCKKYFSLNLQKPFQNRLGQYLNSSIERINYSYRICKTFVQSSRSDAAFVFAVPNTFELLHYAYLTAKRKGLPLRLFLMDDLFSNFKEDYKRSTVAKIFDYADRYIFISQYLEASVFKKYSLHRPSLYFFNPPRQIPQTVISSSKQPLKQMDALRICYVGSIWPMHDSIYEFMRLIDVYNRKNSRKISLTIFTGMYSQLNLSVFENEYIRYGGFINDAELISTIRLFDMGLVATSFSQEEDIKALVATSLLTKLNDYVTAHIPILHFGPGYSASNDFISKHKIGTCLSDIRYSCFEETVNEIMDNYNEIQDSYEENRNTYINYVDVLCNTKNVISFLCGNS